MPDSTLTFKATLDIVPPPACTNFSGYPRMHADIFEQLVIALKEESDYTLTVDSPVMVSFGGLVSASFLYIKANGAKVDALLTSADGTAQVVPVDSWIMLTSESVPIMAVSLLRLTGVQVTCRVVLGQLGT